MPSHIRAASAITAGSEPNNCAEMGRSSSSNARYRIANVGRRAPREFTTPCELVNSVIISPHPPWLRIRRRNTVSVTPAMGASTVAGAIRTGPTEYSFGNCAIIPLSDTAARNRLVLRYV
jgi:hypothetical protein